MSASREKKARQEQVTTGFTDARTQREREEQAKARRSNIMYIAIAVVFVLVAIVVIVANSKVIERGAKAVTIGSETYTAADVDYYFRSYAAAKGKLRSADYQRSYAGMYAKGNSLEDLWAKHNRDSRPFAHRMRSMSVSDIVVLTQGGKKTAYYADTFGFQEVPEFLAQQRAQKKHKERGEAR